MSEFQELLCWRCRVPVEYEIKKRKVRDAETVREEGYAECSICHSEITIPGLVDLKEIEVSSVFQLFKNGIKEREIDKDKSN